MSDFCQPTRERLIELLDYGDTDKIPADLQPLQAHYLSCETCQGEARELEQVASLTRQALALWPSLDQRQAATSFMLAGQEQLLRELRSPPPASGMPWRSLVVQVLGMKPRERLHLLREAALRLLEQSALPEAARFQEFWQSHYSAGLASSTARHGEALDTSSSGEDQREVAQPIQSTDDLVAFLFLLHRGSEGESSEWVDATGAEDPVRTAFLREVQARLGA